MPFPFPIDWKKPDYRQVYDWRLERLKKLRSKPSLMAGLRVMYRENPAQFIIDWGSTFDPRNVDQGLPAWMPFLLFPKQEEWVHWFLERWAAREAGLIEKSRDMGMSWLTVATAASLCIFRPGVVAGFGSRKEDLVDRIGDPDSLFWKAREFVANLPPEFRGGWERGPSCSPFMRMIFPDTGSMMRGEAGDSIGRGGRTSFYFVDEAAHIERPELVDASLVANTNCRIDLSSVKGTANPFAAKRFGGKIKVFSFHWRDDPRKSDEWAAKKKAETDPVVWAQEYEIDYAAAVEGVVIPAEWVRAAEDAHLKLRIVPSGELLAALDVCDEGKDKNGYCAGRGILVSRVDEWSGVGTDIMGTVEKAFLMCDEDRVERLRYDGDGLGAGVRGDARVINERRRHQKMREIPVDVFQGSDGVFEPERVDKRTGRKNIDLFMNRKAQGWWALRARFDATYRAVVKGEPVDHDSIISLDSRMPLLQKLMAELSQPTWSTNALGKLLIDKAPDGVKSPNLADSVMMRFAPTVRRPMKINPAVLARA